MVYNGIANLHDDLSAALSSCARIYLAFSGLIEENSRVCSLDEKAVEIIVLITSSIKGLDM